jgi:triacylglycerol lipase
MKPLCYCVAGSMLASCTAPDSAGTPRVTQAVLVHGFGETGSAFGLLKRRLEKRGIRCFVPRLKPADGRGGLEKISVALKRDIDQEFGPDSRLAIVSFSMGGIVSRYYLQELAGAGRCDTFITISSPHHGTQVAWLYPSQGAAEMRPGSPFLAMLEASEDRLGAMPVVSYRTPMDLVIVPPTSSVWDRAENLEYPVILHPLMLSSQRVIADIERRLMDETTSPAAQGAGLASTSTLTGTTPRVAKPSLSATPIVTSMIRPRM